MKPHSRGAQHFNGERRHPLLRASWRAIRERITINGVPNRLNNRVIFPMKADT